MDDLDFLHKINDKISSLTDLREKIVGSLMDGDWHASEVKTAIDGALKIVDDLDEEDQNQALRSVVEQLPGFVLSLWKSAIEQTQKIDSEKARWEEMHLLYNQFLDEKKDDDKRKEQLQQSIEDGEIAEPSRMASMRRKKGTRPPITLKEFRNFASKDDEPKTSSSDGS